MTEFSGGGNIQEQKFASYKWCSVRITIKNTFGSLKARFTCSQRVMDVNINTLPQVVYLLLYLRINFTTIVSYRRTKF